MNTAEPLEAPADTITRPARKLLPGLRPAKSRMVALCVALATVAVLVFVYNIVNEFSAYRGVTIFDPERLFVFGGQSLDSRIPYLPWTLYIYISLLLLYFLPVVTYPKTESGARALLELYGGLVVVTLAACLIYVVSPAEISREAVKEHIGTSQMHSGVLALQQYPPFNTWPSLHVAQSGLIFLMVAQWLGRLHWSVLLFLAWVALSISTLTVKEHFVWDVVTGSLLAFAYWHYRLKKVFRVVPTTDFLTSRGTSRRSTSS